MVKINLLPIRLELRKKALVEHIVLIGLCVVLTLIFEWFVQTTIVSQRESLIREVAATKVEIKKLTVEAGEIEKFKQQKQELEKKARCNPGSQCQENRPGGSPGRIEHNNPR